jgi:Protein of unknown function (DUF1579)
MSTAQEIDRIPRPITPGPEMEALHRFHTDVSWVGTIHEGGMGPGTPAMRGVGRATVSDIQDGRWLAMDAEQEQFLEDGTFVLKWQLHWVVGWSPEAGEYRASMVDNYGHAMVYRGWIEGDRLVFESMGDAPVRLRFTWETASEGVINWKNEMALGDGEWFLIEEYPMTPVEGEPSLHEGPDETRSELKGAP